MGMAFRKIVGFSTVGLLSFMLSTPGWALDHDERIAQMNADSAQIASTLRHSTSARKSTKKVSWRKGKKKKVYYVNFKSASKKRS